MTLLFPKKVGFSRIVAHALIIVGNLHTFFACIKAKAVLPMDASSVHRFVCC